MYPTVQFIHSYWAYLVVLIVVLATFNALIKYIRDRSYGSQDFRVSLFTLIVSHLQFIIGLILLFSSPYFAEAKKVGMGELMKNEVLRLYVIEHPTTMLLSIILITIGYSKHKKERSSRPKFKKLAIFYSIGLLLLLSRIPWDQWFN